MLNKSITELIGWLGTLAIITAYALLSFGVITGTGLLYQLLNAAGAGGIVYHSLRKQDYQPAVLNVIWTLIALVALIRILI